MALLSRPGRIAPRRPRRDPPGGARRALGIALLAFALFLSALLAAAWLAGDASELEVGYEGFD
jgi:hypothetical protein